MTDRQLIELGAHELAARHGFNLDSMRQRDFEYLCTRIEESSGILISLSTIKRILNGQYNRLPQVATLNAIAVNLGYDNWQAFKAAKQAPTPQSNPVAKAKAKTRRLSYPLIAAGIVGLFIISLLSFNYFSSTPAPTTSKYKNITV